MRRSIPIKAPLRRHGRLDGRTRPSAGQGRPLRRAACLLLPGLLAALIATAAGAVTVEGIRHWSAPHHTRVVIELSREVETRVHRHGRGGRVERLYLDLPGVRVPKRYAEPIEVKDGLLKTLRLVRNRPGLARFVIELQRYQRHRMVKLDVPHRIVVDVYDEAGATPGRAGTAGPKRTHRAGLPPANAPSAQQRATPPWGRGPMTVVIDPGHGGKDPGAVAHGIEEKDLVLRVGRELRRRLRERGFRVVMTRERDKTLGLEERTALAEAAGGDVFVSLHANAARRRGAAGIETYYLDDSHETHTLHVAARENGVSPQEVTTLSRRLTQFRIDALSHSSRLLASNIQRELVGEISQVYGAVNDLGVRKGPFQVLFLLSAPAALVEIGFLTNPGESRRMKTRLYRDIVAEQIARALSAYRRTQLLAPDPGAPGTSAAALQGQGR